jgi:hypothetical protein
MGYENSAGLGVNNHYGVRSTGGSIGVEHGYGTEFVVRIDLTGQSIADAIAGFVPPIVIPKGANFDSYKLRVDEAFVVTGTTPALSIGLAGSVGTNYISLSEAELEAVGTKEVTATGAGTMAVGSATGVAANAKLGFALTGTTPAIAATQGKATLIMKYTFVTKV